jgi:hypothetical protein
VRAGPDKPVSLDQAVTLGQRGRPKKGEEKGCNATLKRGTAAHWLARLDRDGHAELAGMRLALLYPEPKHGGARKKGSSSETKLEISKARLSQARAVLAYSHELAGEHQQQNEP